MKLLVWSEEKRLKLTLLIVPVLCRVGLWILNIQVTRDSPINSRPKGKLLIANHLSYLDILVLFAHYPALFITSQEIKETFLLGRITELAGCFFVERRKSKRTHESMVKELEDIKKKLLRGHNIFLFPEGTSSDGKSILPFKSTFFQTAIDSGAEILPLCLRYTSPNGDKVCWYGEMTFPDHLFRMCLEHEITVTLNELNEISVQPSALRNELRDLAHKIIGEAYAKN
ncbi:MAG: 1-acyl-sn-glycerol-3-phosphate acyltransferase [Bacteriovoracaceae bacterium]|nr:1-acyl-sn-glycerol-3-phosphate acyltransferase [Bacteriovoracaceae bacterium]